MNHQDYLGLKDEIKAKDFSNSYKGFSKLGYWASFIGNVFSIIFAYFFVNSNIIQSMIEPSQSTLTFSIIVTFIILLSFEASKRFIFDKFSLELIRNKFRWGGTELNILGFLSAALIAGSFYLSLNGAKEWSQKEDEVKQKTETTIQDYADSVNVLYASKIKVFEDRNALLFKANDEIRSKALKEETRWRRTDLMNSISSNDEAIKANDEKIEELKSERSKLISDYSDKQTKETNITVEKNQDNSVRFIAFSTIIEFVILFGIFFRDYYKVRSLNEYEDKINKDPKYRQFDTYNKVLDTIYMGSVDVGQPLPFKTELTKLLKLDSVHLNNKQLDDALRLMVNLGILEKKGNKKIIKSDIDTARDTIKRHFKID